MNIGIFSQVITSNNAYSLVNEQNIDTNKDIFDFSSFVQKIFRGTCI